MLEIKTITLQGEISVKNFHQAVSIYLKKPQVVNRKLSCATNIVFFKINSSSCELSEFSEKLRCKQSELSPEDVKKVLLESGMEVVDSKFDEIDDKSVFLSIDKFIPRSLQKFQPGILATLIDTTSATFHLLSPPDQLLPSDKFKFTYQQDSQSLSLSIADAANTSRNWLEFVLFKKIRSWMETSTNQDSQLHLDSHQLIDPEAYNLKYAELKEKYGQKLEENWSESTDPKKFVYEDIAIASYLILLWQDERQKAGSEDLQSFADLGCGNGLLVYLLAQEGHKGYGIDLRKRKIWDQFSATTDLREIAIVPSDQSLFDDVDWIIGNHSDELSPWIPVISARSSYNSRYFLLPCCAYEFSGVKFQRRGGTKSQYLSYIDYLIEVSAACGFSETKLDRMKIPSTKRICLVGSGRTFPESQFQEQCKKIQKFIDGSGSSEKWSESFQPREKIEIVRNCTRIDSSLKNIVVDRIFQELMRKSENFDDKFPSWNRGGEMTIPEAAELVSAEDLKKLKSEFGGLQTLLRNRHQVFHVYGGSVRIRLPKKISEVVQNGKIAKKKSTLRTLDCYFLRNHPNSCPLLAEDCCYIH